MAVVSQTLQAFSFDGVGNKAQIQVQAGTEVRIVDKIRSNFVCVVGIPSFQSFLIIPAANLKITAEDQEEQQEDEDVTPEVGVQKPELSREDIEEPDPWAALSTDDVAELEEVAQHKEAFLSEEFDDYLSDKVTALDSPLLQRLRNFIVKKNPDLPDDQVVEKIKQAVASHATTEFIRTTKKDVAQEKKVREEREQREIEIS